MSEVCIDGEGLPVHFFGPVGLTHGRIEHSEVAVLFCQTLFHV